MTENLNRRVATGIAWMTGARAAVQILGLISTLVLARLLTPADFGIVAMATAVAAALELLTLFGFDTALIQRRHLHRQDYDTAWTLNLLLGLGLALALAVAAGPAAAFYREPRLEWVIMILGARHILRGAANPGTVDFRRELDFRREFLLHVVPKLSGLLVIVPLAFQVRDYRALIAGMILVEFVSCAMGYRMHPHRPRPCLAEAGSLFRFSRWLLFNNFITVLRDRAADFIIGRALGPTSLGAYTISYEIANLPATEMVAPINRVLFPTYVKLADQVDRLRDSFRATLGLVATAILPASLGLAAVADPLVRVALGEQWLAAIPLIALLGFAGAGNILQTNTGSIYNALGMPRLITLTGAIHMSILLPLLIFAVYRFGLIGAAWAHLVHAIGIGPLITYLIFLRLTPIHLSDVVGSCWRPVIAGAGMYVAVRTFLAGFDLSSGFGTALVALLLAVMVGVVAYVGLVLVLWVLAGRPEGTETALLWRARGLRDRMLGRAAS